MLQFVFALVNVAGEEKFKFNYELKCSPLKGWEMATASPKTISLPSIVY